MSSQTTLESVPPVRMDWPAVPPLAPEDWAETFAEAYCRRFRCSRESYPRNFFWRALQWRARPFAFLVLRLRPDWFREDFEVIAELAGARNHEVFKHDVNLFHARNLRHGGFLRRVLGWRISGKRLLRIKNHVLQCL